jgi:hypothetical protein
MPLYYIHRVIIVKPPYKDNTHDSADETLLVNVTELSVAGNDTFQGLIIVRSMTLPLTLKIRC